MSASGRTFLRDDTRVEIGYITIDEIRFSISEMQNHKSPGPDGIPVEFLKLLDDDGLAIIQDILEIRMFSYSDALRCKLIQLHVG